MSNNPSGPSWGGWRSLSIVIAVGLATAIGLLPNHLSAQSGGQVWRFTADPFTDLWFHGMALVDPVGPGPNPLYDPSYPATVRRAKAASGISTTSLDGRLGYFRDAFRADPAFEVLHFLPLYFPQAGRLEIFSSLKGLAALPEGLPEAPTDRTSFGLAAVGSVLTTPAQRTVLGEFVQALESEWTEFFQDYQRSTAGTREAVLTSLRATWNESYSGALRPFLVEMKMTAGLVLLTPPLGMEGRVFTGSAQAAWDNVLAVSTPRGFEDSSHAIFAMIREISFPSVRRAMVSLPEGVRSEEEEESRAARAAVRSGALILELYCPDHVGEYQSFFLSKTTSEIPEGTEMADAFRKAFPLTRALEEALREEVLETGMTRR